MAECKVKRDVTVTLVLSEEEAMAIRAVMAEVQGGQRDCNAVYRALREVVGPHPDLSSLSGVIKWTDPVPF